MSPATRDVPAGWRGALVAAVVTVAVVWWTWGALNPIPVVSDEQSYVLQSRIFASGHWTAPAPPVPEAFEQSHVLTDPAVASKFPPGHALLLAVGTLLGSPAIASLLISALTGALLFLLVRRIINSWAAATTIAVWLSDPINLRFRPSYFSEMTTQLLWLAAFWALLEWRSTRDRRWLFALAAAIGWGAITRPLTMLAFAVPVGVIVIRDTIRLRAWRPFAVAVGIGVLILGVLPLWSAETTGNWRLSPVALYQQQYLPFDHPGFGADTTAPAKALNPVNQATYAEFLREHQAHTPAHLAAIAWDRLRVIGISEWGGWRVVLVPFVLVGLLLPSGVMVFGMVCAAALFVGYLSYGHFSEWTLYYFEATPILSVIAALGIVRVALWIVTALARRVIRNSGLPDSDVGAVRIHPGALVVLLFVLPAALVIVEARAAGARHIADARYDTEFNAMLDALPKNPTVVFVHYTPALQQHPWIVRNSPHLDEEPIWIVNDIGARDSLVMRAAGPRVPLNYFEDGRRFELARDLMKR